MDTFEELKSLDPRRASENSQCTCLQTSGDTPGIESYIMELLYRNGVNIIDASLGHGDIIMVVTRTGWTAAYDALRREVAPGRNFGQKLAAGNPDNPHRLLRT